MNRAGPGPDAGRDVFLVDTVSGEIVEAEIFLNSFFDWSVAAAGEAEQFDLESIALHEVGHLARAWALGAG